MSIRDRSAQQHRPAGGPPCAPSAGTDPGEAGIEDFDYTVFYGETVLGDFTVQDTGMG